MSLDERLDYEENKISALELFAKTCCHCKHWMNRVTHQQNFCHKCINNPKIPIKKSEGCLSIEDLRDYHASVSTPKDVLPKKQSSGKPLCPLFSKLMKRTNVKEDIKEQSVHDLLKVALNSRISFAKQLR